MGVGTEKRGLDRKCSLPRSTEASKTGVRLEFHVGWSGWTRPPTMKGGGASRAWLEKGVGVLRLNSLDEYRGLYRGL